MSEEQTITLKPRHYEKLGAVHCAVTRDGFVAVAGDVREIADGETITIERSRISVTRRGDDYTFARLAD
jgi:metal-dependent HD superfamily phosphatase/phosphodiesterase